MVQEIYTLFSCQNLYFLTDLLNYSSHKYLLDAYYLSAKYCKWKETIRR